MNEATQETNHYMGEKHPVVDLFCDEMGYVYYERMDMAPLKLPGLNPGDTRKEALRRAQAILDATTNRDGSPKPERFKPISDTGKGLTAEELKERTWGVCLVSREKEYKWTEKSMAEHRSKLAGRG